MILWFVQGKREIHGTLDTRHTLALIIKVLLFIKYKVTPANGHGVTVMHELLNVEEERVYGDSGYIVAKKYPEAVKKNKNGKNIKYIINRRPSAAKWNTFL